MFDEKTIQNLKYYVYGLINPETKDFFYIGKGVGNRIFNHVKCALESDDESDKLELIRKLIKKRKKIKHVIIRHGLKEREAIEIEASVIDTLKYLKSSLTNIVGGHGSIEKGLMTTDEIIGLYNAKKLEKLDSNAMIININKTYKRGLGENAIYKATKETWSIGKKRTEQIKFVLSEYKGLIVEVFEIIEWYQKERGYNKNTKNYGKTKIGFGFNGKVAEKKIREKYINKSIAHIKKRGAAQTIRYNL